MKQTQWEKMVTVSNRDLRRDDPDSSVFLIEVSGFDCHGRYFTEKTMLAKADQTHCSFHLGIQVPPDSVVAICFIRRHSRAMNSRPELFEVAYVGPAKNGWHIQAAKLLPESVLSIASHQRGNRGKQIL
jgi:hypothetical protein